MAFDIAAFIARSLFSVIFIYTVITHQLPVLVISLLDISIIGSLGLAFVVLDYFPRQKKFVTILSHLFIGYFITGVFLTNPLIPKIGLSFVLCGLTLNGIVIAANKLQMPVTLRLKAFNPAPLGPDHVFMSSETRFRILGDWIYCPSKSRPGFASIGDFLILFGFTIAGYEFFML